MQKNFIILSLLILNISYGKNTHIKLKSSFESNFLKNYNTENDNPTTSIKYIPLEGKIYNKTKYGMFNVFFKIRGERKDIKTPDNEYIFVDSKMPTDIPKGKIIIKNDEKNLIDVLVEDVPNLQRLYSAVHLHYHGPHEHDEIGFDEECEEEHEYEHNHDTFSPLTKKWVKPVRKNNDFQPKIGIEYLPNALNKFSLIYMPTLYRGDEIRYYKSFILDAKSTNLLKDNLAIALNTRLTTINNFTPYLSDIGLHFRYALDENTTIGLSGKNKFQLNILKDYHNFKNSINIFYDYNKEKYRAHKFYEILDHEHEKLEQYKLDFTFNHNGAYTLPDSQKEKLKYARKVNIYEFKLKQKIKKPNFLINNLTFENVTNIDYTLGFIENAHKYVATHKLYSVNKPGNAQKNLKVDEVHNNYDADKIEDLKPLWFEKYNDDLSKIDTQLGVIYKGQPYIIKKMKEAIYFDNYQKENRLNLFELKNVTKLNYKNFELKNSLYFSKNNVFKTFAIDNELKASYTYKKGIFEITPYSIYNYDALYNLTFNKYKYHVLTPGIDFSLNFKKNKNILKIGVDTKNDIQFRVATEKGIHSTLGNKNEINKMVIGNVFYIKPYVKISSKLTDNITVKTDFNYEYMNSFDVTRGGSSSMFAPKKFTQHNVKTKFSLQYEW